MDETFGSAKSSFEGCDYKFKIKIVEAEEKRELGISISLGRNKNEINMAMSGKEYNSIFPLKSFKSACQVK